MQSNGETQGELPSLNAIISGNEQEPNQVTYTTIKEQPNSTTKVVKKVVTSQQPVVETSYYSKKVTTTTTTTRGNQGPSTTTNSSSRYSNTATSNRNQTNSYSRPTTQTNKTTTTTTTTTVQRGQSGQNSRNPNTNSSQVYRGEQRNVKSPTKIGNSQSYVGNKYQPNRPQQTSSYKPKAKSPEPGSIKKKTINRGDPLENVQITHIIYTSRPTEFHITENLNLENLNSAPIQISKAERAKLQKNEKVKVSSKCSCDDVEIAQPKKVNLKGKTLHYQHAQGLGMTNDKNENINPLFYSSEIKQLKPLSKLKGKEIIENVEVFRSNGKVYNSPSPNKTTSKTTTKTTTYNRNVNNNQNQNYRSGATNSSSTRGGMASSTSGRGGGNTSSNNRGGAGTTVKTTTTYTRGNNNMGSGGDGEIIKDTRTKVQMGSRSYKNSSQPTTYTTTERKVYTQKNFFDK